MGLDMYLNRKKYIGANYEFNKVKGVIDLTTEGKNIPVDLTKVSYIVESVGYWRKANHIHKWFVDNVQEGVDDCKAYYVSKETLNELLEVCKEVKANPQKASELLPTQSGFFFGSTEYDEYYFADIDYTIELIEEILKEDDELNSKGCYPSYEYDTSW